MSLELLHIARRISRQLALGRGMMFDAEQLDLLAAIGVNDLIQAKAAEAVKAQAQARAARRGSITTEAPRSLSLVADDPEPSIVTSRKPRTTSAERGDVQQEFARAQTFLKSRRRVPVGNKES